MNKEMNAYGLTGNMGCGKSTVAEYLKRYDDVRVLDCDQISKNILFDVENIPIVETILGESVVKDGMVNGRAVSKIIFSDSVKKQSLEKFIHPLVWQNVQNQVQNGSPDTIFVVESALIYETQRENDFKGIIVATCDEREQFERIKKRNNWSDDEIIDRLKNQLPRGYKEENGLIVINTNCSLQELESKVEQLYSFIKTGEKGRLIL